MSEDEDWIEVRRVTDAIGAEMIRDFLQEHDVRVAIRGNPQATRMTWSQTSDLIRIVVAPSDLEKAEEALTAMTANGAHPFRGLSPIADDDDEKAARFVKPRSALSAAFLAVVVPIGGGHFYARHGAAGTILAAGIIGAAIGMFTGRHELARAWALLVVIDMIGAVWAVRRYNEKRLPSESAQRRGAMIAVVLAFATAWLTTIR